MAWTESSSEQDDIILELAHRKRPKMVSRNRICLSNVNGTRFSPVSCRRQRQHTLSVSNDVATHLSRVLCKVTCGNFASAAIAAGNIR